MNKILDAFPVDQKKQKSAGPMPLWGILIICAIPILIAGLMSSASLGDEIHHYRFAKDCFLQKGRALFDSLYPSLTRPAIFYITDPAWPVLLSWIWRLFGRVSLAAAQIYHLGFYLLLFVSTYFGARHLYSREQAWWGTLLVATTPMIVSFSVLFYTDMPATALVVLSFWLLLEKRVLAAGLMIGAAFLMKKTTVFFIPVGCLYLIYDARFKIPKALMALMAFGIPPAIMIFSEFAWRAHHFPASFDLGRELIMRVDTIYKNDSAGMERGSGLGILTEWLKRTMSALKNNEFTNSNILSVFDQFKYLGMALITGLGLYFFRRKIQTRDLWLWGGILIYTAAIIFLRLLPDIRYLMPVIPFVCILAARPLAESPGRIFRGAILGLCALQLFSASLYTGFQRRIPEGIQEGFRFMSAHTPPDALILYPELNILEYAGRRMVWGFFPIRTLFWGTEKEKLKTLKDARLNYIAVKKSRIYKDEGANRHVGGYPQSFLDHMRQGSFAKQIFENEEMSVWEINPGLLEHAYAAISGKGDRA